MQCLKFSHSREKIHKAKLLSVYICRMKWVNIVLDNSPPLMCKQCHHRTTQLRVTTQKLLTKRKGPFLYLWYLFKLLYVHNVLQPHDHIDLASSFDEHSWQGKFVWKNLDSTKTKPDYCKHFSHKWVQQRVKKRCWKSRLQWLYLQDLEIKAAMTMPPRLKLFMLDRLARNFLCVVYNNSQVNTVPTCMVCPLSLLLFLHMLT
jgi:hypothetical protein